MKLIPCPVNGPRPSTEFQYGGPLRPLPDPAQASDAEWAGHVFHRTSLPGARIEWWCHLPSGVWFLAERDTAADRVLRTWLPQPGDPMLGWRP